MSELSLGEHPHDPAGCHMNGRPHLGPCVDLKAADLPDGSVVANGRTAFIKNHPTRDSAWRGTDGSYSTDWYIDSILGRGAVVLREGEHR